MTGYPPSVHAVLETVPGIPCEGEAPVFAEPWQAQAFAMVLTLQQRGVFTWNEWADELGAQIKIAIADGDPDDGTTYYRHWLMTPRAGMRSAAARWAAPSANRRRSRAASG